MKINNYKELKTVLELILKLNQGESIKNICNTLNDLNLTYVCRYDGSNNYSSYHVLRRVYASFKKFGIEGLFDTRGLHKPSKINDAKRKDLAENLIKTFTPSEQEEIYALVKKCEESLNK